MTPRRLTGRAGCPAPRPNPGSLEMATVKRAKLGAVCHQAASRGGVQPGVPCPQVAVAGSKSPPSALCQHQPRGHLGAHLRGALRICRTGVMAMGRWSLGAWASVAGTQPPRAGVLGDGGSVLPTSLPPPRFPHQHWPKRVLTRPQGQGALWQSGRMLTPAGLLRGDKCYTALGLQCHTGVWAAPNWEFVKSWRRVSPGAGAVPHQLAPKAGAATGLGKHGALLCLIQ